LGLSTTILGKILLLIELGSLLYSFLRLLYF
jgi:hypothetical protein